MDYRFFFILMTMSAILEYVHLTLLTDTLRDVQGKHFSCF